MTVTPSDPLHGIVHSDPEILGGAPVFIGTRVPLQALFDYLEAGDSLDRFLDHFPSVRKDQVVAALELARSVIESRVRAARRVCPSASGA